MRKLKLYFILLSFIFLSGCFQSSALLGPGMTIISTGNVGCIAQISSGTKIPIIHTVEIIDWYTGGPKPHAIEKL